MSGYCRRQANISIAFLLVAGVLFASSVALATESLSVETTIHEATVFPQMARVSRMGKVSLQETGVQRIDLVKLNDRLNAESFRFSGSGSAKVRVLGTSLERLFSTEDVDSAIAELVAKLDKLKLEDRALADDSTAASAEKKFVESLLSTYAKDQSLNMATKRFSTSDWEKAGSFVNSKMVTLAAKIREIDVKRNTLAEKITEVKTELDKLRSKRGRWTHTAHIDIEVLKPGMFLVEATYVLHNAGWMMTYDARLNKTRDKVEIGVFASVGQRTGEDWENVKLILSTARPSIDGTIPELPSRYIDFYSPPPAPRIAEGRNRSLMKKSAAVEEMADAEGLSLGASGEVYEAEYAQAAVDTVGLVTFTAPAKAAIPSDDSRHKVFLFSKSWKATPHHEAVPEFSPHVYTVAETINHFDFPLLQGATSLYFADTYLGNAQLNTTQSGEKLLLPFGIDERVRVERKLLNRKEQEKGLISKTTRLRYNYEIKLTNTYRDRAIKLMVRERIPVSRQKEIEVRFNDKTTGGYTKDDSKPGIISWEVKMLPGAEQKLILDYSIEYPRDKQVYGLP